MSAHGIGWQLYTVGSLFSGIFSTSLPSNTHFVHRMINLYILFLLCWPSHQGYINLQKLIYLHVVYMYVFAEVWRTAWKHDIKRCCYVSHHCQLYPSGSLYLFQGEYTCICTTLCVRKGKQTCELERMATTKIPW